LRGPPRQKNFLACVVLTGLESKPHRQEIPVPPNRCFFVRRDGFLIRWSSAFIQKLSAARLFE